MSAFSQLVYLPGVLPHDYKTNERVDLFVNLVRSSSTLVPYSYYSLPVCRPKHLELDRRNLGLIISGSAPFKSLYDIFSLHRLWPGCRTVCGPLDKAVRKLNNEQIRIFSTLINERYEAEWIVDNMPVVVELEAENQLGTVFQMQAPFIPLGRQSDKFSFPNASAPMNILYNHHKIIISYQKMKSRGLRIVGVRVEPRSIKHSLAFTSSKNPHEFPLTCWEHLQHESLYLNTSQDSMDVVWTYSVDWVLDSQTTWENRYDGLFREMDWESHWFGLFSGLLIMVPFSMVMAAVFWRTCRKSPKLNVEEEIEQTGWKLLHGDVFRAPQRSHWFAVFAGSGVQMLALMGIVSLFSVLGMLAPPNRGSMLTATVILYVLLGFVAGYISAKLYRQFNGLRTLRMMSLGLILVPGSILALFFLANVILWQHRSSAGLSAWMVLAAVGLWGVHSILALFGMFLGTRVSLSKFPTLVNNIPRFIPKQPWYNNRVLVFLCSGIIPFAVFWIELYYLLEAIWMGHWVATFAFVFLSILLLTLATAFVSILAVFLRLRTEDYHWWWRSFFMASAPALYVFFYMMYFIRYMKLMSLASLFIYLIYSSLFCLAFAIYLGGVGIASCYYFVTIIYGALPALE